MSRLPRLPRHTSPSAAALLPVAFFASEAAFFASAGAASDAFCCTASAALVAFSVAFCTRSAPGSLAPFSLAAAPLSLSVIGLVLMVLSISGRFFCPNGVPTALLPTLTGTVSETSSGLAGLSGLTFSSADAMPVPSISSPPVTSAVCRPRFAQFCMVMILLLGGVRLSWMRPAHRGCCRAAGRCRHTGSREEAVTARASCQGTAIVRTAPYGRGKTSVRGDTGLTAGAVRTRDETTQRLRDATGGNRRHRCGDRHRRSVRVPRLRGTVTRCRRGGLPGRPQWGAVLVVAREVLVSGLVVRDESFAGALGAVGLGGRALLLLGHVGQGGNGLVLGRGRRRHRRHDRGGGGRHQRELLLT